VAAPAQPARGDARGGRARECGLVDYRAEGRQSFYALMRPELMDLLASAEQLLAATGHPVALCPTSGQMPDGVGQVKAR
jgi:hypothetical protein